MCENGIMCIGLLAILWPLVGLVVIGIIYVRQFVHYLRHPSPPTFVPLAGPVPRDRHHHQHSDKEQDNGS